MLPRAIILWAFVLSAPLAMVATQSFDNVKDLYTELFETRRYNKHIRPIRNQTHGIDVITVFHLTSIIDFDEQEESLTTAGAVTMIWKDDNLSWNETRYGDVDIMFIPQEMIWRPDITLSNSFETLTGFGYKDLKAVVFSNGVVNWNPYQIMKSTCDVDITYFPFDTQTCSLKFAEWSYTSAHVRMQTHVSNMVIISKDYSPNAQWTMVDSSAVEGDIGTAVAYYLKLQRKPAFYVMNIIMPVVLLTILSVFTFVVPLQSGERASYAITVFLSKVVFLTIIASEFPKNSDTTPVFGVYLLLMACISTIIAIITVLELRLISRDDEPNPRDINAFYRAIYKLGAALMCKTCSKPGHKVEDAETTSDGAAKSSPCQQLEGIPLTWKQVLEAMDMVFFVLCSVTISFGSFLFFIVTANNPDLVENKYSNADPG